MHKQHGPGLQSTLRHRQAAGARGTEMAAPRLVSRARSLSAFSPCGSRCRYEKESPCPRSPQQWLRCCSPRASKECSCPPARYSRLQSAPRQEHVFARQVFQPNVCLELCSGRRLAQDVTRPITSMLPSHALLLQHAEVRSGPDARMPSAVPWQQCRAPTSPRTTPRRTCWPWSSVTATALLLRSRLPQSGLELRRRDLCQSCPQSAKLSCTTYCRPVLEALLSCGRWGGARLSCDDSSVR